MGDVAVADATIVCIATGRQGIDVELDRGETSRFGLASRLRIGLRCLVVTGVAVVVHANLIAEAAPQQLPDGRTVYLPRQIP